MKRNRSRLILITAAALMAPLMAGCDNTNQSEVEKVIAQAQTMDRAEIFKKSMEEIRGKDFYALGNSSRGKTAIEYLFNYYAGKKYDSATSSYVDSAEVKTEFPAYDATFTAKPQWSQPKNNRIFTQIASDVTSSSHTFSMTLIQDGNQIKSKMLDTGYLSNYIPKEWAGDKAANGEPLALQSLNKVFVFNNQGTKTFTNCWDFVGNGFKTQFMLGMTDIRRSFVYVFKDKNLMLWISFFLGLALQIFVIETPTINTFFGVYALSDSPIDYVYVFALAVMPLVAHEFVALGIQLKRRKEAKKVQPNPDIQ